MCTTLPSCSNLILFFNCVCWVGLFDESKCPTLIFAFFVGGWWTLVCVGSDGGGVSSQEWEYGLRFDFHDNPTLTATHHHHHHSFSAHFHDDPLHRSNILWSGPHLLPLPSFLFFASEMILLLCVAGVGGASKKTCTRFLWQLPLVSFWLVIMGCYTPPHPQPSPSFLKPSTPTHHPHPPFPNAHMSAVSADEEVWGRGEKMQTEGERQTGREKKNGGEFWSRSLSRGMKWSKAPLGLWDKG